ncbi:hypothetical protein, unlikely [Trypanosoma congolense IL3000]|uniref:Uncharacterized protein n=1 Tax=Trypanosoma congolense (strain IL3000) TaxID=1068625 RepID=F9W6W4_TRYCI|nr:hypothetical protein, unlikely [Trypanosoma congolense IL3000]
MFGRRVVSCCPIPKSMYSVLHINTKRQASRLVPPLVPLTPSIKCVAGTCMTTMGLTVGESSLMDLTSNSLCLSVAGPTSQFFMSGFSSNPILMRVISDTMCTYSVLLHLFGKLDVWLPSYG